MQTREFSRTYTDYRLSDNPRYKVKGFLHEQPPTATNVLNPPRLFQAAEGVKPSDLIGKMLISTGKVQSRLLISEFMSGQDHYVFVTYEANEKLTLYRERDDVIHPVTKMPIKDPNPLIQEIWVNVYLSTLGPTGVSDNPISEYYIRSAEPIFERDVIGGYKVKQVVKDKGLYFARADFYGNQKS